MKKQDLREMLAALFRNELTPEEEQEIYRDMGKDGLTPEEIEALDKLSSAIEKVFDSEPSRRMDDQVYSMIERESRKEHVPHYSNHIIKSRHSWILIAAGIALFILGWFSASMFDAASFRKEQLSGLSGQIKDLKETLVLTMLGQSSASERIKAVNMIREFDTVNGTIIENLFKALNTDENDNVRLLALEALIKYTGNSEVRQQLVSSISKQTSPMIQLRMTEIMTVLNEKSSVPEFRRLLNHSNLNYSVRTRIQEAVGILL